MSLKLKNKLVEEFLCLEFEGILAFFVEEEFSLFLKFQNYAIVPRVRFYVFAEQMKLFY